MTTDFSLHYSCQSPEGEWVQVYQETLKQAQLAENLGYRSLFVAEHHFLDDGWVPTPLVLLAGLAAVTEDMVVGTDIIVLPLHHPIEVAEQATVLDNLSGGNLRLGVAIGWRDEEFQAFGVPKRQRVKRTVEGVQILRRLFTEKDVSYNGDIYQFEGVSLMPRPVQDSIPIWIGGQSEPAIRRAAKIGDTWITSQIETLDELNEKYDLFEEALTEAGKSPVDVHRPLRREAYIAEDDETAWEEVGEALFYEYNEVYGDYEDAGHVFDPQESDAIEALKEHAEDRFIIGGPETAIEEFERFRDELNVDEFLLRMHFPGLDPEKAEKSIRILGEDVMPYFQ